MGIYVHIPFCKKACHYCNFFFSVNDFLKDQLVLCIIKEIKLRKDFFLLSNSKVPKINTIYFGGGTPSLLSLDQIQNILKALYDIFIISNDVEITFEMNPEDAKIEYLRELKKLSINRLSMGIQTFDDNILRKLNRSHTCLEAHKAIKNSRKANIDNLNLDLIYSIPNRDHTIWNNDLDHILFYEPKHISAYSLTIEKNTYFGYLHSKNKLSKMVDKKQREQYDIMIDKFKSKNYIQYEVSNFAKPNNHSKHNLSYWQQKPYLGIGPSAHSYNVHSRLYNIYSTKKYIDSINKNILPITQEILTIENQINEYIMTGLRSFIGVNLDYLKENYDFEFTKQKIKYIQNKICLGFLCKKSNTIHTTQNGYIVIDEIIQYLFI